MLRLLPLALTCLLVAAPLVAQQPDTLIVTTEPVPAQEGVQLPDIQEGASPGGAFLRALLIPGWGHASIGSYTRGGFYFLAESGVAWMLVRTLLRGDAAEAVEEMHREEVAAALGATGVTDPALVAAAQDADPLVTAAGRLVEARRQQFEDWLAVGIAAVFLSAADAFVSAHLQDFPEPVQVEFRPVGVGMGVQVGVNIGLPKSSR